MVDSRSELDNLVGITVSEGASDLHLVVGKPPTVRIDSVLAAMSDQPILDAEKLDANIFVATSVAEAATFFNGTAPDVLIIGDISGAHGFVKGVRHFRDMRVIGLIEQRTALANAGCNCFVGKESLSLSVAIFLNQYH